MLPHLIEKTADTSRSTWFWAIVGSLAVGQLTALWMVCSQQVRNAEARAANWQIERTAVADCLRDMPRATLDSCTGRSAAPAPVPDNNLLASAHRAAIHEARAPMSNPGQVNFALR